MPLPRGSDPDKAVFGYMQALQGFPVEAIAHGIRKFLRGECEDVSTKFCPHPPELAAIIRGAMPRQSSMPTGRLYRYRAPASQIIKSRITKGDAWDGIEAGEYPRGSIWCPGPLTDRPEIGDLYGPDPSWRKAVPLNQSQAA